MQVILLHDVERVGHEGDILKVSDGYARNYLVPRGLAVVANRGMLKDLEQRKGAIERRDTEKREAAQKIADELRDKLIVVKHVTGEGKKLHGTVTTQQIADAAQAQLGLKLDKRDLEILEPIREIGDYLVTARVYKDVSAELPVRVISDKSAPNEADDEDWGGPAATVAPLPEAETEPEEAEAEDEAADEAEE